MYDKLFCAGTHINRTDQLLKIESLANARDFGSEVLIHGCSPFVRILSPFFGIRVGLPDSLLRSGEARVDQGLGSFQRGVHGGLAGVPVRQALRPCWRAAGLWAST